MPNQAELRDQLLQREQRLRNALRQRLETSRVRLARLQRSPVLLHPRRYMLQHAERMDMLHQRLIRAARNRSRLNAEKNARMRQVLERFNPREQIRSARKQTDMAQRQLESAMRAITKTGRQQLHTGIRQLDALSPLKVMVGYSLVYDEQEKRLIKSLKDVQPGDSIKIKVSDGQLDCQVWGMKEDAKHGGE